MALIKWTESPFEAMDRMFVTTFDDLENRFSRRFGIASDVYVPSLDIAEDTDNFYIFAELPGLRESDVKVTADNDMLTISGKKERTEEKSERNYHRVERSFGQFVRSLSLPKNVKANAVRGTFKDGLLELTLPKIAAEKQDTREIPLNAMSPRENGDHRTDESAAKDDHSHARNGSRGNGREITGQRPRLSDLTAPSKAESMRAAPTRNA